MYQYFTDEKYRQIALNKKNVNYQNNITSMDAFLILLSGLDYETIDNLCIEVSKKMRSMFPREVYYSIQNRDNDPMFRFTVLNTAYEIIHSDNKIGSKLIKKHNASNWISHSLFEGELASRFAKLMGLDSDTAMKIGILHDIGRKFDQSFSHTIKGFEYLVNQGLRDEAFCTLTHSFLSSPVNGVYKGNRCANCDPAIDGFYIDENGKGVFKEGSTMDDMAKFLENYEYNPYDIILNISDLMAMSKGITSPYDRMMDVYTRRKPDSRNNAFFKVCFINALNSMMYSITKDENFNIVYNIKEFNSSKEIDELLLNTSNSFMDIYNEKIMIKKQLL